MPTELKGRDAVARAIYEAMEGPVSNQDFNRQQRQWESAQALAIVALEAYEAAKPKEAGGQPVQDLHELKLGSRLTVEGVEAVVVPVEPMPEMLGSFWRVKNGHHFHDDPAPTDTSDYAAYRAMLSAAGDGG